MNAYAISYMAQHLDYLHEEAALRRAHPVAPKGPSLRERVASAVARIRAAFPGVEDQDWGFLPKVQDYPYRG